MRSFTLLSLMVTGLAAVQAFSLAPLSTSRLSTTRAYGYVPDGFTPAQWKKQQEKEAKAKQDKSLGRVGPKGFKSRSFQSFHEALERGETGHLLPVFNAKEKLKSGEIKKEDIPYMQRGGSWDNSDVKGAKKSRWLNSDKSYASGGFRKEQSVSVFGVGQGLDWSGTRGRQGPTANGYKAPNVKDMKKGTDDKPKKKNMFGF